MEDEIDQLINEITNEEQMQTPTEKSKFLTIKYWKGIIISIYSFFYFFFYSLIHPVRTETQDQQESRQNNNNRNQNQNINPRNLTNIRRPNTYRYRSQGGG